MGQSLVTLGMQDKLKKVYYQLQRIPLAGFFLHYFFDVINLPRKVRTSQNESVNQFTQIKQQLAHFQQQLIQLDNKIERTQQSNLGASLEVIKSHLSKTVFYQPLYGYVRFDQQEPQRPCIDRADAIYAAIRAMGATRLLDVGCSFGYFSYYFAERGYHVDGLDFDQNCINICNFLAQYNLNNLPSFENANFDLDYIYHIPIEKYSMALLLSVLHHVTSEKGVSYVQNMMQTLVEKIPMLIVELALCEEDVPFPWKDRLPKDELDIFATCQDIHILKLGCFSTHLSSIKRPLYVIFKKNITINNHQYDITQRRFVAHEDAGYYYHVFYETKEAFIKNYRLQYTKGLVDDSKNEILNEIKIYQELPSNNLFPKLIDYYSDADSIKLVLSKLPGNTLKHHLENNMSSMDAVQILKSILKAVKLLWDIGYYHNDIRAWNIMFVPDTHETYLFDLGRADKIEHENTITAVLWIIYQLQNKKSINYLKYEYPLIKCPEFNLDLLQPELQKITKNLFVCQSIDEYFKLN